MAVKFDEKILASFGIVPTIIQPLKGDAVWIVDDKYILKQSSAANIVQSAELAEKLILTSIPVAAYIKTADGSYVCEINGKQYCLMTKLQGEHINPFDMNAEEIGRKLGFAIASLDNALKGITLSNSSEIDYENELHDWIEPEIIKAGVEFDNDVFIAIHEWLPLYHTLPRQPIHRDLHTDNMLFCNDEFAGFIDFDMSQINARIFDICYFGCTLLVEEYKNELQLMKWQDIFSAVLDEYILHCQLTDNEIKAMPMMFVLIEIIFTAFFCKIKQLETAKSCVKFVNWLYCNQALIKEICDKQELELKTDE